MNSSFANAPAVSVQLQTCRFTQQLDPGDRTRPREGQALERGKCETDRVPESGHDQLLAAGGLDRREELGVLGVIWSSVFGSRIARLVMSVSSNLGFDRVYVMIELSTL